VFVDLPSPTLLLPRSLVLAAVLVVVTGAMVAVAPSHRDAEGAIAAVTTTWILKRPREWVASHLICSRMQFPARICNLSVGVPDRRVLVHGRRWSSVAVDVPTDVDRADLRWRTLIGGLAADKHLVIGQVLLLFSYTVSEILTIVVRGFR